MFPEPNKSSKLFSLLRYLLIIMSYRCKKETYVIDWCQRTVLGMKINERIKQRRKELGLGAEEVAHSLGISRATFYRYEASDQEKIPSQIIEPLARILQTTPSRLMGWEEDSMGPQEEREILRILESTREQLLSLDGLMFDGKPATEEAVESILAAMQIGLEMAKKKDKENFSSLNRRKKD